MFRIFARLPCLRGALIAAFAVSIACLAGEIPVVVRLEPPKSGTTLSLSVICAPAESRCHWLSMPTAVLVQRAPGSGWAPVDFGVQPAEGANLTLTLAQWTLMPGQRAYVKYRDFRHPNDRNQDRSTNDEPVIPSSAEVQCCQFKLSKAEQTVRAWIPFDGEVFLQIRDKDGALMYRSGPRRTEPADNWALLFDIPVSVHVESGDAAVVTAMTVPPRDLARGTVPKTDTPASPTPPTARAKPPGPGPCADAYLASAPSAGDTVQVILGCPPQGDLAHALEIQVGGKPQPALWSFTSTPPITYTAKLTNTKLSAGQAVKVFEHSPAQRDSDSPAQIVPGPVNPPNTVLALSEGATSVTGFASGDDNVRVQVVDGNRILAQKDTSVDSTTNQFSLTLDNPLQADQQVKVYGLSKGVQSEKATSLDVAPLALDWGRVRAYFTAGVLLSNNNSEFNLTSANTFMGFDLDKQWAMPVFRYNDNSSWWDRVGLHTYLDARLTAIPTGATTAGSTATQTTSPTTGAAPPSGSSGLAARDTTGSTTTANPSSSTSLLNNSQAASLQIGTYIPITVTRWRFNGRPYSLFAGPLAKAGFYTLTGAGSASDQAAANADRSDSRFFPFYGYGVRIGQYREYRNWDGRLNGGRAPELLSYLDVVWGRWANFEYLEPLDFNSGTPPECIVPAADPTSPACLLRQREWRIGFEGLLLVPNTPLVLGLSANVSAQRFHRSGYLPPPDDLRFLFGVRFDASKLTSVLGKLGGQ
jgi:hypothetical protein